MGKITRYHPISLHVVRGAAEYCGFKFGTLKQVKSDPTGLTATYKAQVTVIPKHCKEKSPEYLRFALQDCFNADIKVESLSWTSKGSITATIKTAIYRGSENIPLPEPEIKPIQ